MLILLLTVAMVHFIALLTPGPDFFFVSQTAASRSRTETLMGVLGITLGIVVWAGVALMGLHIIMQKMAWLHKAIMIGGGVYLLWMSWQLFVSAYRRHISGQEMSQTVITQLARPGRAFLKGLFTNLANPKALIYFGSIFSLFVGDDVSSGQRWGVFLLVVSETAIWFSLVAIIFSLPTMRQGYQRMAKWIDGIAGTFFAGFGIHLLLSR